MQIDTKIDPRWCEALLGMLEGDLNHNRVAEVKRMLRIGIDSIRKGQPCNEPTDARGCLFSGTGRGDCKHFVGLPGKSIPGKHDGDDDTVDEYGRPNGWCEVCWRGRQIQALQLALFQGSKAYGGVGYAKCSVDSAMSKAKINTPINIKELADSSVAPCFLEDPLPNRRTAYLIEAKKLSDNGCLVYLRCRRNPTIWTPDVNMAFQFCRRIDAERYMEDDGTCQVVARVVLPDGAYFGPVAEKEKKKEML